MAEKGTLSSDELIQTHEKASSPDSVSPEKLEEQIAAEKTEKTAEKLTETSRKRKIEETIDNEASDLSNPIKRSKIRGTAEIDADDEESSRSKKVVVPIKKKLQTPRRDMDREPSPTETDPLAVWTAEDDMALVTAVAHVSCLRFVHETLPFSRKFSFSDLEERYCQLLYDEKMSDSAKKRMAQIPFRKIDQIKSRTPFSRGEEKCLQDAVESKLLQLLGPDKESSSHTILRISHFKTILEENKRAFHFSRTPQVLLDHFRRIKGWNEKEKGAGTDIEQLEASFERGIGAELLDYQEPLRAARSRFHSIARKPALRGIQNRFQTSASVPDNAIAMVRGQFLSYAMTSMEALLGRSVNGMKADIDLSIEGPACKISRQQAIIRQSIEGDFTITNVGQRPLFVDCKPLPQMVSTSLKHGSIIEIASIRLVFSIPVPRVLHPLTKQGVQMYRKTQESLKPTYQQYQKQSTSTTVKKPRAPRNQQARNAAAAATAPEDHDRLLKTVGTGF